MTTRVDDRVDRDLGHRGSPGPEQDVVIIGAGPYGLSAGAHLKAEGVKVRV